MARRAAGDTIDIQAAGLPAKTWVVSMRGREWLSDLYEFRVRLVVREETGLLDFSRIIGQPVRLRIAHGKDHSRKIYGIVSQF